MNLNTIARDNILTDINNLRKDIDFLMALVQGQPVGTARIRDAAITNAKIVSLVADKITAGNLIVQVGIGSDVNGSIILDGVNVRETMSDADDTRYLCGDDGA